MNATEMVAVDQYGYLLLPVCRHSEASPILAVFIFLSFTLLCAFVLMSIMIAVVTTGIGERIEEIQGPTKPPPISLRRFSSRQSLRESSKRVKRQKTRNSSNDCSKSKLDRSFMKSFDPELVLMMLREVWRNAAKEFRKRRARAGAAGKEKATSGADLSDGYSPSGKTYLTSRSSSIDSWTIFLMGNNFKKKQSIALRKLIHHPVYTLTFTFVIILAAFLQLIVLQESKPSSSGSGWEWIEWLQYLIQAYFMVDIFMQVKAHNPNYLSFLDDSWNAFDLILVILTLLPIFATGTSAERSLGTSAVRSRCFLALTTVSGLFRVGRILRVLRLLTWIETLDLILRAIADSMKALLFVIILMAIFFYNYAIMGVFLFKENDPDHFGTLPKSFLSLFQVSRSATDCC
jgi:hypothetical protein